MKVFGFSLAEALITLLIVCVVAIATAPLITKKHRKTALTSLWQADTVVQNAVTPTQYADIRLGTENDKKQGIVIVGTMYFKDRSGKTIGWISEDGSSSFSNAEVDPMSLQKQEQILQSIQSMMNELNQIKQKNMNTPISNNSKAMPSERQNNVSADEMQNQLSELMKMMNMNK